MTQIGTYFNVLDNSGATSILCIQNLSRKSNKVKIGDLIVGVIKSAKPTSNRTPSEIVKAVVVRTKNSCTYKDGTSVVFTDNAVALVDHQLNPLGTRLRGSISKKIKELKYKKLHTIVADIV